MLFCYYINTSEFYPIKKHIFIIIFQVERCRVTCVQEIAITKKEEIKAKSKKDKIIEVLKEEEATVKRTFINLPVQQYNNVLNLYK